VDRSTKWEADASMLCCHLKPADVGGSCNSKAVRPCECSTGLVPDTLCLLSEIVHSDFTPFWWSLMATNLKLVPFQRS